MDLRANTAVDVLIGPFVDKTDGNTTEDGLTLTAAEIKLSKNGQALTLKSDVTAAAFDDDGYYNCELDATDLNTEGSLVLIVHQAANALPVRHEYNVLAEAAWDSQYAAKDTGFMDVNIKAINEDETSPPNLDLMYDGTGYTGVGAPASREQVDGITGSTGGSFNIQATHDNAITDTIDAAPAVDKGGGLVGIPVTGHAFITGNEVTIAGTTNYNAVEDIVSQTTNEVVITATYNAETFGGTETIISTIKSIPMDASVQAGTFASTEALDGVVHDMDDVANNIDIVYQFKVGGGRTATEVEFDGFVQGNGDEMKIKAYDHVGTDWEVIATITGQNGTGVIDVAAPLLLKHTGTGSDLGRVFIRIDTDSTTPSNLTVDRLLVSAVNVGQTVGYANGAVWIDTNNGVAGVEAFVNGVADNHALTMADVFTLLSSVGLKDVHVVNGSAIVLGATADSRSFFGDNWTLDLDGRSCANAYFQGAAPVSGTCTAASEVHFEQSDVTTASVQLGHFDFCGFGATLTMTLAGDYNFHDCYSKVAGAGAPTFTKTAGQAITGQWRRWSGGITLSGIQSTDTFTISGELGTVTLNGSDGTVEIRGTYKNIVDNRGGAPTLNMDGAIKGVDVASTLADTNELQTDWADGGRLDLIQDIIAADTTTDIPALIATAQADLDTITGADGAILLSGTQASVDAIEADTNELQVDWVNGGRLDLILDAINVIATDWTDGGRLDLLLDAIKVITDALGSTAAANLALSCGASGVVTGAAATGTLSTTQMSSDLSEATNDHYIGRAIVWTSGVLAGQATDITDYVGTNGVLTFTATTEAPSNLDAFIII